jgi:hypothetical protein
MNATQPTATETTHTPGTWYREGRTVRSDFPVGGPDRAPFTSDICKVVDEADGDRIVACVNACKGINPEAVPEMLEALRGIAKALDARPELRDVLVYSEGTHGDRLYPFDEVPAAISKATK